ncbi:hypothetical protein H4R35_004843 [Dimargaris xerosporica]|nr:hypothetical protein H4R35_004843 [Dimargaris xerosporica]
MAGVITVEAITTVGTMVAVGTEVIMEVAGTVEVIMVVVGTVGIMDTMDIMGTMAGVTVGNFITDNQISSTSTEVDLQWCDLHPDHALESTA